MKKLGKKINYEKETLEAYCYCAQLCMQSQCNSLLCACYDNNPYPHAQVSQTAESHNYVNTELMSNANVTY